MKNTAFFTLQALSLEIYPAVCNPIICGTIKILCTPEDRRCAPEKKILR